MNIEDIKPGVFVRHFQNPNKIHQIIGIALTEDCNKEIYNREADFIAEDTLTDNAHIGYINNQNEIIISWNKTVKKVGVKYVLHREMLSDYRMSERYKDAVLATELDKFLAKVNDDTYRFTLI